MKSYENQNVHLLAGSYGPVKIYRLAIVFFFFRTVCRKQELLQLDLEKSEDLLSSRASMHDQLVRNCVICLLA